MFFERRRAGRWVVVAAVLALTAVPATGGAQTESARTARTGPVFFPDDPVWRDSDDAPIPRPDTRDVGDDTESIRRSLQPPTIEAGVRAVGINTLGEVPNSSWFINRQGSRELTEGQLLRGPDRLGPPVEGTWKVVGFPGDGRTPKLTIEDADGRTYLIKFETPANPEMMSAAEVVCTKFFHALGYHVPENHVVIFDPARLHVDPEVDPREFPAHDLEDLLAEVPRRADGTIRAVASSWLSGVPVGPFRYEGTRIDDPNDVFPHQHRRELRGLRVFAAWLNHTDIKPANTLDMYVGEDGAGYVRHHLIDFGSCMGSGAEAPKDRLVGYERYLDVGGILKGVFTFGLWSPPAASVDYVESPAIGNFESDFYEPWLWKPPTPNPAFLHLDAADAFWAARIVASFDDAAVADLVSTGRISDPDAERLLLQTLIERRDKTVAYWLTRTNPLDSFWIEGNENEMRLGWHNAAERHGLLGEPARYGVRWFRWDNDAARRMPIGGTPALAATPAAAVPADPWGPADRFGLRYAMVEIRTVTPDRPHWDRPVVVTLRRTETGVEIVGVERPAEMPPAPTGAETP